MSVSGHNLIRTLKNLSGRMFGYESCAFCGDRANWKPWMDPINVGDSDDGEIEYQIPLCKECFFTRDLNEVLNAIKADITEANNFHKKFDADPAYRDTEQEYIIAAVEVIKHHTGGTPR